MLFRKKKYLDTQQAEPKLRRRVNPRVLLFGAVGLSGILAIAFLISAVFQGDSHYFILAAGFSVSLLLGVFALSKVWHTSEPIKIFFFTLALEISIALFAGIFTAYSGFPYAVIAIVIAFFLSGIAGRGLVSEYIIFLGLLGAIGSVLLTVLAPLPQISNQVFVITATAIAATLALFLIFLFARGSLNPTLRVKLIIGGLALTLVPLIALSLINNQYLRTSIQDQSNQSLLVAVDQTALTVDTFFKTNLETITNESSLITILDYLKLDPAIRSGSSEEAQITATFRSLQTKEKVYLPSYGLINLIGLDILDTDSNSIGKSERFTSYFSYAATTGQPYASAVEFIPDTREAYVFFISPIFDVNKQPIGFLRSRYDARILQSLIQSNVGLIGTRSYPILIDENGLRLADGFSPNLLYRSIAQFSTEKYSELTISRRLPPYLPQSIIALEQPDFQTAVAPSRISDLFNTSMTIGSTIVPQSGIVKQLQNKPWSVIFVQDQTTLTESLAAQNRLSAIISTLISLLVAILITVVANAFTRPILDLADTAEKISTGDFSLQAKVTSTDEIGVLGNSFNLMTRQLKELIDSLESRVLDRTQQLATQNEALQFRSRQLQTVADVARNVVSTQDFESLLTTVTTLLGERFDFYHVGIFLIDESGENAVLRATNSSGGRKMLERGHKLQVGQVGIVGYVTGTGEPRIATDVGQDATFFNNPDLPQTKSEMALPLKVGEMVIGALDVQSNQSDAFSQQDIELFTTLSDQIAIAINNNQLFTDTAKALEVSERLHRQYLNQEWSQQSKEISSTSYKFTPDGIVAFKEDLPEIKMVLDSARPVYRTQKSKDNSGTINSILAVPILLRGESIGVIHLQETASHDYIWSQNELSTIQAVADQVAQTLENARLFEQTIRRADRERKVLEITSKIRSTNDPQMMLQITLEELRKNLGATKAQIVLNIAGELPQTTENDAKPNLEPMEIIDR